MIEQYFLRGIKRFKYKDESVAPGTPMPTSEHPIQSFQWGDYTAKPDTTYRFKVVPVYGKPKHLELDEASAATVEITTEAEKGRTSTSTAASPAPRRMPGSSGRQNPTRQGRSRNK